MSVGPESLRNSFPSSEQIINNSQAKIPQTSKTALIKVFSFFLQLLINVFN